MTRPAVASLFLLPILGSSVGCDRLEGDPLVIASPWPAGDRAAAESAVRAEHPRLGPVAWVALAPGDDPARLVPGLGVDLAIGLAADDLDRLAAAGHLATIEAGENRPWRVSRRLALGSILTTTDPTTVAFDDPRRDPVASAWMRARLDRDGWAAGFARLVRLAAGSPPAGPSGSAEERCRRGEAESAATVGVEGAADERSSFVGLGADSRWIEGVAIVRGSRREAEAREVVRALGRVGMADAPPDAPSRPIADAILDDLLGATLVDARAELRGAVVALRRAGQPEPYATFLGDPPPWPPTSVAKLQAGPDAPVLLEALAREISPDLDSRRWLLVTWRGESRPIDRAWFAEVASAADGRLAAEPRFRAWLRAEWRAWARQHGRRIAREAAKAAEAG